MWGQTSGVTITLLMLKQLKHTLLLHNSNHLNISRHHRLEQQTATVQRSSKFTSLTQIIELTHTKHMNS